MKKVTQEAKPVEVIGDYVVMFEAEAEHIDPRKYFVEECGWSPEAYRRLRNQSWFSAKVSLWAQGQELSVQYLGGCAYDEPDSFWRTFRKDYYADMVMECFAEAGFPEVGRKWLSEVRG